jgi:uncharacterized damage-inducible protein DinB
MDFQQELIFEFGSEVDKTRKILAAIPADVDFAYKPHPKSMSLGQLAGHTAGTAGQWALGTLTTDKLELSADHKPKPYVPSNTGELLERFDKETAEVKAALASLAPEKWEQNWKLVFDGHTVIDETRYRVFQNVVINHLIHHRAQLGVYLRLLGDPIPGTYGPSADEM